MRPKSTEAMIRSKISQWLSEPSLSIDDRLKLLSRLERPTVDALEGVLQKINAALRGFEERLKRLENSAGMRTVQPAPQKMPNLEGIQRLG